MSDASPAYATIAVLSEGIATGRLNPVKCASALLERIDAFDAKLHAFIRVLPERALAQARSAESALQCGAELGALHVDPFWRGTGRRWRGHRAHLCEISLTLHNPSDISMQAAAAPSRRSLRAIVMPTE